MDSETVDKQLAYIPLAGETISAYQWMITPAQSVFTVTCNVASGVHLTADALSGLFHPDYLRYRDGKQLLEVSRWEALPAGMDLYDFHPTRDGQRDYILTVTAQIHFIDSLTGSEQDYEKQQSWTMTVRHDYSSGRALLEEYFNASSHT
ncbi:hypothetical protein [Celerinatantimonas diazotrophica]|nr:hypothetical protein [Celerinatantimonas diazotrophica]